MAQFNCNMDSLIKKEDVPVPDIGHGIFSTQIRDKWYLQIKDLDSKLQKTITNIQAESRNEASKISVQLAHYLKDFEKEFEGCPAEKIPDMRDQWLTIIDDWREEINKAKEDIKQKCIDALKEYKLKLTNLNLLNEAAVENVLSKLVKEFNQIIVSNEQSFIEVESKLKLVGESLIVKFMCNREIKLFITSGKIGELNQKSIDKRKKLAQRTEENEIDQAILQELAKIKKLITKPLPVFRTYGHGMDVVLNHMDDCKNKILNMANDLLQEIHGCFYGEQKQQFKNISTSVWLDILGFFQDTLSRSHKVVKNSAVVWDSFICRLENAKLLLKKIIYVTRIRDENNMMKVEAKLLSIFDEIRQAPNREILQREVKKAFQIFAAMEKSYERSCDKEIETVSEMAAATEMVIDVIHAELALLQDDEDFIHEFPLPDHGSEKSLELEEPPEHIIIEQMSKAVDAINNWITGFLDALSMLHRVDTEIPLFCDSWIEYMKTESQNMYMYKVNNIERRRLRVIQDIANVRIAELDAHIYAVTIHEKGIERIHIECKEISVNLEKFLGDAIYKIEEDVRQLMSRDDINPQELALQIAEIRERIQNMEIGQEALVASAMDAVTTKYAWLYRANQGILKYIKLFSDGGNFSDSEAINTVSKIVFANSSLVKQEAKCLDEIQLKGQLKFSFSMSLLDNVYNRACKLAKRSGLMAMLESIKMQLRESILSEINKARDSMEKVLIKATDLGCSSESTAQDWESVFEKVHQFAIYFSVPVETDILELEDIDLLKFLLTQSDESNEVNWKIGKGNFSMNDPSGRGKHHLTFKEGEKKNTSTAEMLSYSDDPDNLNRKSKTISLQRKSKKNSIFKPNRMQQLMAYYNEKKKKPFGCQCLRKGMAACNQQNSSKEVTAYRVRPICGAGKMKGRVNRMAKAVARKNKGKKEIGKQDKKIINADAKGDLENTGTVLKGSQEFVDSKRFRLEDQKMTFDFHDVQDDNIFFHTQLPFHSSDCNFCIDSKNLITSAYKKMKTSISKYYSELKDGLDISERSNLEAIFAENKILLQKTTKQLRFYNIQAEQAWIVMIHDYLCLMQAVQYFVHSYNDVKTQQFKETWTSKFQEIKEKSICKIKKINATNHEQNKKFDASLKALHGYPDNMSYLKQFNEEAKIRTKGVIDILLRTSQNYIDQLCLKYNLCKKEGKEFTQDIEECTGTLFRDTSIRELIKYVNNFMQRSKHENTEIFSVFSDAEEEKQVDYINIGISEAKTIERMFKIVSLYPVMHSFIKEFYERKMGLHNLKTIQGNLIHSGSGLNDHQSNASMVSLKNYPVRKTIYCFLKGISAKVKMQFQDSCEQLKQEMASVESWTGKWEHDVTAVENLYLKHKSPKKLFT